MKIRLMDLPEEVDAAVEALRRHFDVLDVSEHKRNRGDSRFVRVYVEVRFTDSGKAPSANVPAATAGPSAPGEIERLAKQLSRVGNVLGGARARVTKLHAKRDKAPASQRAFRKECDARAEEIQGLVDALDKALAEGLTNDER
ncbi:hypothetical protein E1287_25720 [Actinomadura sp. KC06]|uniref:hypothetical protein n=1 Tax=Actinomadura sp. KC06 TaxID=2530369 RepID=UPI001045FE55|nr:hypothetical protein [Actinomadura sp. KC06]TDD31662.1 hypothetical protein E1287_25720 [Actinomadura sp. KC06]